MKNRSVVKRHKQSEARRLRNKSVKSAVRTFAKKYTELVSAGKSDEAKEALRVLSSKLDSAARKGIISKNAAARKKSRMHLFYNASFDKLKAN